MDIALAQDSIPAMDADPFALSVIRDPYPFHEQLRELAPIVKFEKYGTYAVGRYEEVRTVMNDWRQFTSTAGAGLTDIRKPGAWREPGPIVETDPPFHTDIRGVLQKILSPAVIRNWKETFEREAKVLVAALQQVSDIDGVRDIAEAYVLKVFPEVLGTRVERQNLILIGNHNFNALGPQNELFFDTKAQIESIATQYEAAKQRSSIVAGGFGEKLFEAEDAGALGPGVASKLLHTVLRGGMDTTISGIGSALMLLSKTPSAWQQLRADRARLSMLFEEAIRLESPLQTYYRTTTTDAVLAGVKLEKDVKIQVFVGSANRDPRKWPNAGQFDINRNPSGHVAFGRGIHLCIGQPIARLESESLFGALLDRVSSIEPTGTPVYRQLNTLRTLDALPLRLTCQ